MIYQFSNHYYNINNPYYNILSTNFSFITNICNTNFFFSIIVQRLHYYIIDLDNSLEFDSTAKLL